MQTSSVVHRYPNIWTPDFDQQKTAIILGIENCPCSDPGSLPTRTQAMTRNWGFHNPQRKRRQKERFECPKWCGWRRYLGPNDLEVANGWVKTMRWTEMNIHFNPAIWGVDYLSNPKEILGAWHWHDWSMHTLGRASWHTECYWWTCEQMTMCQFTIDQWMQ